MKIFSHRKQFSIFQKLTVKIYSPWSVKLQSQWSEVWWLYSFPLKNTGCQLYCRAKVSHCYNTLRCHKNAFVKTLAVRSIICSSFTQIIYILPVKQSKQAGSETIFTFIEKWTVLKILYSSTICKAAQVLQKRFSTKLTNHHSLPSHLSRWSRQIISPFRTFASSHHWSMWRARTQLATTSPSTPGWWQPLLVPSAQELNLNSSKADLIWMPDIFIDQVLSHWL